MKKTIVIACLVFAMLGLYLYFDYEYRHFTYMEDRGYSLEAQHNPFLAMRMLLEQSKSVQIVDPIHLQSLALKPQDVLISNAPISTDKHLLKKLKSWVYSGGVLILRANAATNQKKTLTDRLGVFIKKKQIQDSDLFQTTSTLQNDHLCVLPPPLPTQAIQWQNNQYQLMFPDDVILQRPKKQDLTQVPIVIRQQGEGWLIIVASLAMFSNDAISYFDHTAFLQALTAHSQSVYLLPYPDNPSLLDFLMERYWMSAAALLFFGVLLFWRQFFRIGPILDEQSSHFALATDDFCIQAQFNWQHKRASTQLLQLQNYITKHSQHTQLNLPINENTRITKKQALTKEVQALQTLRNSL